MVETVRPRLEHVPSPIPVWAEALEQKDKDGKFIYPDATSKFKDIWEYYDKKHNTPSRKLTEQESAAMEAIFEYPFITKITVDPVIAGKARDIARNTKLRPGDSLHVASALAAQCTCLQSWDGDYSETADLIPWERPQRLSDQSHLAEISPPKLTGEGFLFPPP
jgi:predicted nucleic acid-binding protein